MLRNFVDKAKSFKDSVDFGKTLTSTKQFAENKLESGKTSAVGFIEHHWPTFEKVLVEGLISVAEERLKDEKTLEALFEKAYELLPIAARLLLPRERFIEFSMKRRDPLLLRVQELRIQRTSGIEVLEIAHDVPPAA